MQNNEITFNESVFFKMYRNFSFLLNHGFSGNEFSIGGWVPYIIFENKLTKIKVKIYRSESGYLDVLIIKMKKYGDKVISIRNYYKYFSSWYMFDLIGTDNVLKANALFIQDYFLPIIKGEMWIDELLKRKEISNNIKNN